jgi:hypothetical protein
MEPEGSLPCSQDPSTGPNHEPDQSNPYHSILYLLRSILILSSHLRQGLSSGLFASGSPTNTLHAFIFSICVLHGMSISSPPFSNNDDMS